MFPISAPTQHAVDASAPANPFSSTILGGQRLLLTASSTDVVISAQCQRVNAANPVTTASSAYASNTTDNARVVDGSEGMASGYEVLQRIYGAHSSPITAVRWFGDAGGSAGVGFASCDTGDVARGKSVGCADCNHCR